ncbi:MAG: DNA polymerase III subunit gamma/tau, partial [Bacteroidota bacterium]
RITEETSAAKKNPPGEENKRTTETPLEKHKPAHGERSSPPAPSIPLPGKNLGVKTSGKKVSGLSLSSLKAKKEHQANKKEEGLDEDQLPQAIFTEVEMQRHWGDFVKKIDQEGRKILASNLTMDVPKLFDKHTIWLELPNDTMKKEIEREQLGLMNYLKRQLNNYSIALRITVNEESAKKFAFTPQEKYQKLLEKNPAIAMLRKEFDLDF